LLTQNTAIGHDPELLSSSSDPYNLCLYDPMLPSIPFSFYNNFPIKILYTIFLSPILIVTCPAWSSLLHFTTSTTPIPYNIGVTGPIWSKIKFGRQCVDGHPKQNFTAIRKYFMRKRPFCYAFTICIYFVRITHIRSTTSTLCFFPTTHRKQDSLM
jgi:hypothetical protein